MYKFLMRNKKPKIRQKALFKASGPSANPAGSTESQKEPESREVIYGLTKEKLKNLKSKVEQTHIKFSNKETKEYDQNIYRGKTIVEVNKQVENLRDGNAFQQVSKVSKGEKLVLTGNYKVLEFKQNGQERVYWEVVTKNGEKNYILGESITPLKTVEQTKGNTQEMKKAGVSNEQAEFIQETKTKEESKTETKQQSNETNKQPEKSKETQEIKETAAQRLKKLTDITSTYKAETFKNKNLQDPSFLKNILKNDQLSDLQRNQIENSMNTLGLSFDKLSKIISENNNTLYLSNLLDSTPQENETEMAELRTQYELSDEYRSLDKEIKKLEKSNNPEDKNLLSQKKQELKNKTEEYALNEYKDFMDYYRKRPDTKSVYAGYVKQTEALSQKTDTKSKTEFELRYNKLKSVYELASTIQNLEIRNEGLSINRDNIENIDTSQSISQVKAYAKENASKLGLGTKELNQLEANLQNKAFGEEERNLYLLAVILLATNSNVNDLRKSAVIQGKNNNLSLHTNNLTNLQKDKLVLGLANSESISKGFFDNLTDTDNLTETLYTLQQSKSFSKAKSIMYIHELKTVSESQKGYTHLNQIFDINYTGNLSKNNDRYYTKTMEDSVGGANIAVESSNVIRRYSADLSQYQTILQEVEVNGLIDPKKLQNKFNELIKLGALGLKFDEKISKSQKNYLENLTKGGLKVSDEEMNSGLSNAQISLIRYGTVYEQLRDDFLKSSDKSPNRLLEKAGFTETDPQATYSALSTALQYIENGNLAVGGDTTIKNFGDGWVLKGSGSAGVYVLENPKVSTAASLTIKKVTENGNKYYISAGLGVGFGPDEINGGVNIEAGSSFKTSETREVELALGGGLIIGGINVYARGGLKENNILKDKNNRMASGLESISEKKLTKEEIIYLKTIASKPNLTQEDIAKAAQYFPGLEEAIKVDPALRNLPKDKLEVFKSNYIQTMLRQLENMSIEQAEGINWNAALAIGVLITPAPIPYIMPMVGVEWGGDTKIMKLYDNKNQLTEAQLKEQLHESLKAMPAGTKLQIVSESGYAANINGKEVVVKGANETVSNLEVSNPVEQLNSLRGHTGIEFSKYIQPDGKVSENYLTAKLDDFTKLRQGLNAPSTTKVNIYVDPALEKSLTFGHMDGMGSFGIRLNDGQIPSNLVMLKESITTPSTSGGSTTEVKISFTTRENLLTGSDIENSANLLNYISINKNGIPEMNRYENNLNRNKLSINQNVKLNHNFTRQEANLLAEYSDQLISRSSTTLERNTHTPTQKLDTLINKLAGEKDLLQKLAVYTTQRIERGQEMDLQKAYETIETQAKELGYNKLSKEDYLYIFGNLLPDTFRPINSLTPEKRIEAINKLANQYVEDYVRSLTKNNLKPNGERFTESETQIIIKNLSKHSMVKDSFKASLEGNQVALESANKLGLTGYEIYTTAHKGKLKGLRRSQITPSFDTQIVKGSLTKFDTKTIENEQERLLVNQFLQSMGEQLPTLNSNDFTLENLKKPLMKDQIKQVLNSKTALQLMSTTPFSSNGKKVSLLGAMYGPDALMHIESFYAQMDKLGTPPVGRILPNGAAREAMVQLINDIQKIDQAQGTVKLQTYKGEPLEINIKEDAGVVLIGKCANPTYVYQRKLNAKLSITDYNPAAAKASTSKIYKLGSATRENMSRIGFATKLSLTPDTPTPNKKPPEKIPPKVPPKVPPKTPPSKKIPPKVDASVPSSSGNNNGASPRPSNIEI